MSQLVWTPHALRDVQRHHGFLVEKNAQAAQRAVKVIQDAAKHLRDHPSIGRPVDGMAVEFREWLIDFGHDGFVMLYRIDQNQVVVLAVRHQKESGY